MRKKTYKRQNRTRSNKRNIKRSKRNIKRNSKRNKTSKKRMRGGTSPRTRSQSPNRSTNTSSPPQSTLSKITDMVHNTFFSPSGQYRKNGVMLYKANDTIVGQPSSPSSIEARGRSLSPIRKKL